MNRNCMLCCPSPVGIYRYMFVISEVHSLELSHIEVHFLWSWSCFKVWIEVIITHPLHTNMLLVLTRHSNYFFMHWFSIEERIRCWLKQILFSLQVFFFWCNHGTALKSLLTKRVHIKRIHEYTNYIADSSVSFPLMYSSTNCTENHSWS